jgi:hypothetical protein
MKIKTGRRQKKKNSSIGKQGERERAEIRQQKIKQ